MEKLLYPPTIHMVSKDLVKSTCRFRSSKHSVSGYVLDCYFANFEMAATTAKYWTQRMSRKIKVRRMPSVSCVWIVSIPVQTPSYSTKVLILKRRNSPRVKPAKD